MAITTTNGQLYFIDLSNPQDRMEIQFIPDEIRLPREIKQGEIYVVGRNNPLLHYASGNDLLHLKLDFYAEDAKREDAIAKVRWLQTFGMNDANLGERPRIKLVWGNLFRKEQWVLSHIDPVLSQFNKEIGFMPQQAHVDISLTLDPWRNTRRRDVRQ